MDAAWSSSTLTWATAPTSNQTLVTYNIPVSYYVNSPSTYRYSCDITDTVKEFYSGTRFNNGFMIRYTNEGISDYNAVYSSDCGTTNVMPVTVVYYSNLITLTRRGWISAYLEQGEEDWYKFIPSDTANFTFLTTGSTDTYGELYRDSTLLEADDDDGDGTNFSITRNLAAGIEYRLKVKGINTSTSGDYSVTVNYPARSAIVNNYYDQGYVTRDSDTPAEHISFYLNYSKDAFLQVFNMNIANNTPQSITSIADNCPSDNNSINNRCVCLGIAQVCNHDTGIHHCKNGWALATEIVNIVGSIPAKTFPITWSGHIACGGGCIGNNSQSIFGAGCAGKWANAISIIQYTQDNRDLHSIMATMHELAHCFGANDNDVNIGESCDDEAHCIISANHNMEDMIKNHAYSDWFCTKHRNQIINYLINNNF